MPELTPLHQRLAALEGAWEGTEALAASPWSPGGTAHARITFGVAAGGFALVQDYRSESGLTGHGVFSISGDEVLYHWFDSFGFPVEAPARGGFEDGALVVERTSPRGTNRTTFSLAGDELRQRIEFNGQTVAEATYQPRR